MLLSLIEHSAMNTYEGVGGMTPLILHLDIRWA